MTKKNRFLIGLAVMTLLLGGCAKRPPKCSDSATEEIIAKIFVRQLLNVGKAVFSDSQMMDYIDVHSFRKTDYDGELRQYSCQATISFGDDGHMAIAYDSLLSDESGEHEVYIHGINNVATQIAVASFVSEHLKRLKSQ